MIRQISEKIRVSNIFLAKLRRMGKYDNYLAECMQEFKAMLNGIPVEFRDKLVASHPATKCRPRLDDLLRRKPHLGSRRPSGDIGQGRSQTRVRV